MELPYKASHCLVGKGSCHIFHIWICNYKARDYSSVGTGKGKSGINMGLLLMWRENKEWLKRWFPCFGMSLQIHNRSTTWEISSKAGWRKKAVTSETELMLTTPLTWMVWLWPTEIWPWKSFHFCQRLLMKAKANSPKADTKPWSLLAGGTWSQETDTSNYSFTQTEHIKARICMVWTLYVISHSLRQVQFSLHHSCAICLPL